MDWDRIRIFTVTALAGSFAKAAEQLHVNPSSVSRQVQALEEEMNVTLFVRHARGLTLTEQGELLLKTGQEMMARLETTRTRLADSGAKPFGPLVVTTTVGIGASWLTPRIGEFLDLYPDIRLQILLADNELDLSQREADAALWLRPPTRVDLVKRKLFTVHFHVYASTNYLREKGLPEHTDDLAGHRIMTFAGAPAPIKQINWLEQAGLPDGQRREPVLTVNSLLALKRAVQKGIGLAMLPDYLVDKEHDLVSVLPDARVPELNTYYVYPEALRQSKRINVFRDFLLRQTRRWCY